MTQVPNNPFTWGGEFRTPVRETAFRDEHLPEYTRHLRLVFGYALLINLLFYINDFRFLGQPHFPAALAGRTMIVLASLACLLFATRALDFKRIQRLCLAWSIPVIAASAVLVSPQTDIALFVMFMLPLIFYLALPMTFGRTLTIGLACSIATLATHLAASPHPRTHPGFILAMLTVNVVLVLVVIRSNRLQRLAWAANQDTREANRELCEHRLMLQTLLRAVPAPLVIMAWDSGRLIEANDAAHAYFGDETLRDPKGLRHCLGNKELARLATAQPASGEVAEFETRLHLADGTWREVLLVTGMAMVQGSQALLAIVVDITNRKEMETHLRQLASSDPLTGLVNRVRFFSLADTEIRRARRFGWPISVAMLDIDYFKRINDSYGHKTGDMALVAFAELCRRMVRKPDIVGRLGGEEFALLLPETDPQGALTLAERLRAAVAALRPGNRPLAMTVSIGVSAVLLTEDSVDAALSRADQALYAAKRAGRNRVAVHDPDIPPGRPTAEAC